VLSVILEILARGISIVNFCKLGDFVSCIKLHH
jgi:hypothetical protein